MARIVKPRVSQSGLGQQFFPFVVIGIRIKRTAVRFREYPALVVPELAGLDALGVLGEPVRPEQCTASLSALRSVRCTW